MHTHSCTHTHTLMHTHTHTHAHTHTHTHAHTHTHTLMHTHTHVHTHTHSCTHTHTLMHTHTHTHAHTHTHTHTHAHTLMYTHTHTHSCTHTHVHTHTHYSSLAPRKRGIQETSHRWISTLQTATSRIPPSWKLDWVSSSCTRVKSSLASRASGHVCKTDPQAVENERRFKDVSRAVLATVTVRRMIIIQH